MCGLFQMWRENLFLLVLIKLWLIHSIEDCDDPVWCKIDMPKISYFGFSPPNDPIIWKQAQLIASSGRPIIAEQVREIFQHPFDFLDGDKSFRNIEALVDYYLDPKTMFSPITNGVVSARYKKKYAASVLKNGREDENYIREGYDNVNYADRAPIIQIGSFRYSSSGKMVTVGITSIRSPTRQDFFDEFFEIESLITRPSIFVCALNENWGWISTTFPNRTRGWGRYPKNLNQKQQIMNFLNSEKVVMLVVNQQINVSHPKLLVLPRGIPIQWTHTPRIVWDALNYLIKRETKSALLVSFSSNWGPRPQILQCISNKFTPSNFIGHTSGNQTNAEFGSHLIANTHIEKRTSYYIKLGKGRFSLMLPGLGYDCFRNWEMLIMGTIGIIERGVGFDRTFWRLPVLLVDDFDEVTPSFLHLTYLEAIYRTLRKEFEFERLQQSYWYSLIFNVSLQKDASFMIKKFPMEAEKRGFVRPFEPFYCGESGELCGNSKIRTPKRSC